jgi:hypothetical protein
MASNLSRLLCLCVAACGSSTPTHTEHPADPVAPPDPAVAALRAEGAKLDAERPVDPYEPRSVRAYKPTVICGQGPYRITSAALGASYGERIEVNVCTPYAFNGDASFTKGKDAPAPQHFGFDDTDTRCVATGSELARQGTGSATAGSGTRRSADQTAPTVKPAAAAPATLEEVTVTTDKCPQGMSSEWVTDNTFETFDGVAVPAKTPFTIDLWSGAPMHLEGAVFIVRQTAARADLTAEQWHAYLDQYRAWSERYGDYVQREVAAGAATYTNTTPQSEAPPPARSEAPPPRPSTHAEWIPGHWDHAAAWVWSEGFWRVPDADLVADETVHAPAAPPAVRSETPTVQPAAVAVWTAGYWAWDGRGYLWITGAWRIPPRRGGEWIAPSWRRRGGGSVFVPGGWSLRARQ